LPDRWLNAASDVARQVSSDQAPDAARDTVVFEGAQGVLLDERFGFHPYTTYSRTTFESAEAELRRWRFDGDVQRIGVLRSYAVRHGPGPLPTEAADVTARTPEPHNLAGSWQQGVRKGWLDFVLLDYALRACRGVDCLALTHVDALRVFPDFRYCDAYGDIDSLPLPASLLEQEALTARLATVRPLYRTLGPCASADLLCEMLAQYSVGGVRFTSYGPRASDVVSAGHPGHGSKLP
jgi:adenylosuccinate synthase